MEKPFDLKELEEGLYEAGVPKVDNIDNLGEKVYLVFSNWLKASALFAPNPVVRAMVPGLLFSLDPLVLEKLSKKK